MTETKFVIRERVTGDTIHLDKAPSLASLVQSAVESGISLAAADLSAAQLPDLHAAAADLSGAALNHAALIRADLTRADLRGADMVGADLAGAKLAGADLSNVNLTGANLAGARLDRANLANADLTGANLSDANLSYCNLYGANLTASNQQGVNWDGVSFVGVITNKVAQDRAAKAARRQIFLKSPFGVVIMQILWCVVTPLGFALFGGSGLWSFLMLGALVALTVNTCLVAIDQKALLLPLVGVQVFATFIMSIASTTLIMR